MILTTSEWILCCFARNYLLNIHKINNVKIQEKTRIEVFRFSEDNIFVPWLKVVYMPRSISVAILTLSSRCISPTTLSQRRLSDCHQSIRPLIKLNNIAMFRLDANTASMLDEIVWAISAATFRSILQRHAFTD